MKRPKNFLFVAVLLSVVAIVLAVAIHTARVSRPADRQSPASGTVPQATPPTLTPERAVPDGSPSAAAQKRAKDFNDATSRFNAPDEPQH